VSSESRCCSSDGPSERAILGRGTWRSPAAGRDPGDADLLATAIRETHEEIGVDLRAAGELTGVLEDQDATGQGTQLALPTRPFVFELGRDVRFTFNHEVTEAVWTPLAPL
jgi:8-oxo-dGTP pyrophosphatase MutT (NUDIX family)